MAKRAIRIRISFDRLEALRSLCGDMQTEFKPTNEHERLLQEYMSELHHKVCNMLGRKQDKYTLMLAGTESMAFYQLWKRMDIRNDAYANIIVGALLHKMSALA